MMCKPTLGSAAAGISTIASTLSAPINFAVALAVAALAGHFGGGFGPAPALAGRAPTIVARTDPATLKGELPGGGAGGGRVTTD